MWRLMHTAAMLQDKLQLAEGQRSALAAVLHDRDAAMDLVARRRVMAAAELQAAAAAGDSDISHILLVQTVWCPVQGISYQGCALAAP